MGSNVKLQKESHIDILTLRRDLLDSSAYARISALGLINAENIDYLVDEIKICAYDYRPIVRVYAYKALAYAKSHLLSEVLKDALRDEDRNAFKAARELNEFLKSSS